MIDFGTNFRKLREQAGLSQEALGLITGLSTSVINRIENNKRKLDIYVICKVSAALKQDVTAIVRSLVEGKQIKQTS